MELRGRKAELAELEGLLERARAGFSGVLVLKGPAGIGKTALLEHAIGAAVNLQVTRVAGVEAEQELGFAGLHRLLLPFMGERGRLPAPQREALETVFGLQPAAPSVVPPARLLVGLAALTLLADAAAGRPLLVVCDDAQWLDRESLQALTFVARRLHAEPLVQLFGVRDSDSADADFSGLAELRVEGLPEQDARALFDSLSPAGVDQVIATRLLDEVSGNPLAIREFARALASDQASLPTDPGLGEPLPLDSRLERQFLRQVNRLDPLAGRILLLAAADTSGDMALIRRAAVVLTSATPAQVDAAVEQAQREDLLDPAPGAGQVAFRHPLIRCAVYQGSPPARRRRAHAALAAASDQVCDPERRAWHLAAAAGGPDEGAAAELEATARQVQARGGHLAQAALLHKAADLTPPGPQRNSRLLAAAGAVLTAGAPHRAEELLSQLAPGLGIASLDACTLRLQGFLGVMLGREDAVGLLLQAAVAFAPSDPRAARDTMLEAYDAAMVAPRVDRGMSVRRVARSALGLLAATGGATIVDLLLTAHAELAVHGYVPAVPFMRRVLQVMLAEGAETGEAARWLMLGVLLAIELWDIEAFGDCARRYSAAARQQGALRMLQAGGCVANYELLCGHTSAAEALYAEFKDFAAAIGADMTQANAGDVLLHAWHGDPDRTTAAAAVHIGPGPVRSGDIPVQLSRTSLVVLALGERRYAAAQSAAQVVFDEDPPLFGSRMLPDLVEAAVRNNDTVAARVALARLAERATLSGTAWALGVLARSRALLADKATAEQLYVEAVALLERTPVATEVARSHLLYGEWLRRRRRRLEAREHLRRAYETFTGMGAAAFAERARIELTATGEHARRRNTDTLYDLTTQELRVARLAASGTTNQQIATELFISSSTVEYHLRKVFRKLGITSRRDLLDALPA